MKRLGIDVGGSGIKGAPVDIATGKLLGERFRVPTPQPARPPEVAEAVASVVRHFGWDGPVGCGFPAAIRGGAVCTASNISKRWIGETPAARFEKASGCPFRVANDADVAGLAEVRFGSGKGRNGLVTAFTFGTGIGSALFIDGTLVPNSELGTMEINGRIAEEWASDRVRKAEDLSWKKWARRVDTYLQRIEERFWPDLIILGGGVSKKHEKFLPHLTVGTEVVHAQLFNNAGIVGAALLAA